MDYDDMEKMRRRQVTPGRKVAEYTDWEGNICTVSDQSLEDGRSTRVLKNGDESIS